MHRTILTMTVAACASIVAAAADQRSAVTYFSAAQVSAAFQNGAVLLDGANTNYMVHASRRDRPGQCEIHTKDTDIIYVLDGTTTFVTGGTCTDPKTTAPDEIRGTAVQDGDVHHLAKGDVIVVPNNTPHWFKDVDAPVLYYVVKVR